MSIVIFPIAIVGLACRLPGRASSLNALWRILEQGGDAVTEIPAERWSRERFYHQRRSMPGHGVSFSAGIVENIYDFDAEFFGISSKEAQAMDPQQRLMLELAWEAMEDALIAPSALAGSRTAVYVGAASPDAGTSHADDICATTPYSMTGTNLSIISNRISYIFDLHGPSMTVDTACSSAMHALHQACQTLACGGADTALAGGVNVLLSPYPFVGFSQAHMLSPDGRCKVFDAEGNGYVRSEGGGLLLLQPLDAALAHGRRIHGVIRAVGLNSDGRTQGIALPSSEAQRDLLRQVYDGVDISPDRLSYMEAHGTGTAAGDPLETLAIGQALGMRRARPLLTGSVKCNLGHLETASAMAGIFKALLVLRERRVPPQIHISKLNPAINFKELNLRVPLRMTSLPRTGGLPLAGVNSFGFGGANGHMLLEAAPPRKKPRRIAAPAVDASGSSINYAFGSAADLIDNPTFFLSARSEASLRRLAGECADLLESGNIAPYDLAAGMALRREIMPHRLVVRAPSAEAAQNALRAVSQPGGEAELEHTLPGGETQYAQDVKPAPALPGGETEHYLIGECPLARVDSSVAPTHAVFAYSGNGGQWAGMGQKLMKEDSVFAGAAEEVARFLLPLSGLNYAELLRQGITEEDMARTELAQPLLFVLQVALTTALRARGVEPGMVMGHSVGEVAAAWACGALTLPDAALVIHHRSLLQGRTSGQGRMAAVNLGPEAALALPELRDGRLELAGINSPDSITLAGESEALAAVGERMRAQNVFFRELPLDYAFHSQAMDQLEAPLREALRGLRPRRARIPFISTVTGSEIDGRRLNADYWWRNIRLPVLFSQAMDAAISAGGAIFMEAGPHPVLQHYMRAALRRARREGAPLSTLMRGNGCTRAFQLAWRKAWIHGWPLRMEKFFPWPSGAEDLPHYRWNRQYHAVAATPECAKLLRGEADHPLLGWRKPGQNLWENTLDLQSHPWLEDHQVGDSVFFPAAAYLEMAMAAAGLAKPARTTVELVNTAIYRPMIFRKDAPLNLRASVGETDGEVRLLCRPHMRAEDWVTFARGRAVESHSPVPSPLQEASCPESFGEEQSAEELYALTRSANMRYGPAFRPVTRMWRRGNSILARLAPPEEATAQGMLIPPPLLDGGLQLIFKLIEAQVREHPAPRLPYWFERCTLYRPGVPIFALARLERAGERTVTCSLDLLDADGNVLLRLANGRARLAERLAPPASPSVYVSRLVPAPNAAMAAECADHLPAPQHLDIIYPSLAENEIAREEEILSLRHTAVLAMALESMEERAENGLVRPEAIAAQGLSLKNETFPHYLLELLERHGLARRLEDGTATELQRPEYLPDFEDIWRTLLTDDPAGQAEIQMLARTRDWLRGKLPPSENGGSATEEQYFRHSPALRRSNAVVAETVRAWLEACPEGLLPRIMEVGAAPGGLLNALLPLVKKHDCRYIATDGNAEALERMRGAVSPPRGSRLSFRVLSLPGDPGESTEERCHCLLLGYCLHQADHAESFLIRCRELLVPGGLLALAELTPDPLLDAFFGQNQRWWAHSPSPTEPASPIMPPQGWSTALQQAGFTDIRLVQEIDGGKCESFVLLARAPEAPLQTASVMPPQATSEALADALSENYLPDTLLPETSPLDIQEQSATQKQGTRFVLLADSRPLPGAATLLNTLRQGLEDAGGTVMSLRPGKLYLTGRELRLRPHSAEDWAALWLALAEENTPLVCVDCLGLCDNAAPEHEAVPEAEAVPGNETVPDYEAALRRVTALTQLARGWDKAGRPPLQLRIVTAGAQPFGLAAPSQSCVLGAARVLMNEMPALDARCLDVDGITVPNLPLALLRELLHPDAEREVLLRGLRRYAPRVGSCDVPSCAPADITAAASADAPTSASGGIRALRLHCRVPGHLDTLAWQPVYTAPPGLGEILVRVSATGLNFRDVMWAMGLLPEEALENGFSGAGLGIECAGEVEAVGPDASGFFVGQRVVCFGPRCFASHVRTMASAAAPMPEGWSFAQAASVPVAFFTAWYALNRLAGLEPGERILIHGAAGGVGMAAIQVAAHLGLEVFATAGTEDKRRLLRLCGVDHVLDSRSYAFREQVMELTSGQGVDAVLNSLAGEGIAHSLDTLRPFGRFLELGKRDFFADSPLRLRPFRNNVSFFGIDVDQLMRERPALGQKVFSEMMELFSSGVFRPLPHTVFAAHEVEEAFRAMQQSRHMGKIVVEAPTPEPSVNVNPMPVRKDGSYIVTGGMGGFGLATAQRLAAMGAGALVLVGRGGPRTDEAREALNGIRAMGCAVCETRADVAAKDILFAALDEALRDLPPLRGIVHAAAVLDDAVAANMTPARIRRVLSPKVAGAFNLHEYSLGLDGNKLDFFVLYSSATTLVGNPGQANYVAANSALEGLAAMRRALGLPALAVGWGAVADAGMLTRDPSALQSLRAVGGITAMNAEAALRMLPALHGADLCSPAVLTADWKKICRLPIGAAPRLEELRPENDTAGTGETAQSLRERVAGKTPEEAVEIIISAVTAAVASVLRVAPSAIRSSAPLADMGMDSLMAVELGLALEEMLGSPPPADSLGAGASVRDMAESIHSFLCGNGASENSSLRRDLESRHGISVNDDFASAVLKKTENRP